MVGHGPSIGVYVPSWMSTTETTAAATQAIGIATLIRNLARSLFSPKLRDLEQPEQQPGEGD
jgi:hypothetical protein